MKVEAQNQEPCKQKDGKKCIKLHKKVNNGNKMVMSIIKKSKGVSLICGALTP